jgi:hypothetical protein
MHQQLTWNTQPTSKQHLAAEMEGKNNQNTVEPSMTRCEIKRGIEWYPSLSTSSNDWALDDLTPRAKRWDLKNKAQKPL